MPGHFSTAVPGPDAKPIFDVHAAVSSAEVVPRPVWGDFGNVYRGDEALRARYARTKKVLLPLRQEHL
jgi:hypothetical protein